MPRSKYFEQTRNDTCRWQWGHSLAFSSIFHYNTPHDLQNKDNPVWVNLLRKILFRISIKTIAKLQIRFYPPSDTTTFIQKIRNCHPHPDRHGPPASARKPCRLIKYEKLSRCSICLYTFNKKRKCHGKFIPFSRAYRFHPCLRPGH